MFPSSTHVSSTNVTIIFCRSDIFNGIMASAIFPSVSIKILLRFSLLLHYPLFSWTILGILITKNTIENRNEHTDINKTHGFWVTPVYKLYTGNRERMQTCILDHSNQSVLKWISTCFLCACVEQSATYLFIYLFIYLFVINIVDKSLNVK